jgi:hypothetical protein
MIVAMGRPRQGTGASLEMRRKLRMARSRSAALANTHVAVIGEPAGSRGFVEGIRNTEKSALLR